METALYGEQGFYRRGEIPAAHFRTSVHASARYAEALAKLLTEVDIALNHPARVDLVDMGAGRGELLAQIMSTVPPDLAARVVPIAVEVAPRPTCVPVRIAWRAEPPEQITGLVIANEWLDNIPLDVVELTSRGPRVMLVDHVSGREQAGAAPTAADREWLTHWWPLREHGDRAEVGRTRCAAWESVVTHVHRGMAIAVDYAHARGSRPVHGTLTGYRDGRVVPPVPDGSCDLTAHVALDACAAAGEQAGATATLLTTQRSALRSLGVTGSRPPVELARQNPRAYIAALAIAGEEAELLDRTGLGGFGWLVQTVGIPLPPCLLDAAGAGVG